jgi:cbb3-type cytochrome oxidase subunit 3
VIYWAIPEESKKAMDYAERINEIDEHRKCKNVNH